jgi:tetratricopeptide (TPR) repeat protein
MPDRSDRPNSLSLGELFTQYIGRQAEARSLGLGFAEAPGDVEPYEAVPVQPVEPRLAWVEATAAASLLGAPVTRWSVPPEWPTVVAMQESAVAVPFCLGNFPQLVRDLQPLLAGELPLASQEAGRPIPTPALADWASSQAGGPAALLAASVLRLARQFDAAESTLARANDVPQNWRSVHTNETAALAWHRGRHAESLALWNAQPASVPVLFNRGMALLFLNKAEDARAMLSQAVAELPETSAWHHLGQLYLTLANSR